MRLKTTHSQPLPLYSLKLLDTSNFQRTTEKKGVAVSNIEQKYRITNYIKWVNVENFQIPDFRYSNVKLCRLPLKELQFQV